MVITAGGNLRFTITPVDENFQTMAADSKPNTVNVYVQGSVKAGAATVADYNATIGYYVEFVPTTPFVLGDLVTVSVPVTIASVVRYFKDSATVIEAADNQAIDDIQDAIDALGCSAGSGSISEEFTIRDTLNNPIPDVRCWISTDLAGTNVVAGTKSTDDFGKVTFMLDSGTYYLWRNSASFEFPNPVAVTI